jgi:hypothetical protein
MLQHLCPKAPGVCGTAPGTVFVPPQTVMSRFRQFTCAISSKLQDQKSGSSGSIHMWARDSVEPRELDSHTSQPVVHQVTHQFCKMNATETCRVW